MKAYHAPKLVEYGDIAALTARSNDSLSQDFELDANGEVINTGLGSLNSCIFRDENNECIFEGDAP
jgi:hypothetical protein